MPGLHLHHSNRLEALADALADAIRPPLSAPLAPETVVVQSLGMRRWIAMELAKRAGVSMNVRFPFPAEFAQNILTAALPDTAPGAAFSRDVLPWRVLELLRRLLGRKGFEELRAYTAGEPHALKAYQLAQRIAAVFDRYLAYRPQRLIDWQQGREAHWQAQLWRELIRGHESSNPPMLAQRLAQKLRDGGLDRSRLPERASVFGISSLPPMYIDLLGAVSGFSEVHLFLLEPTSDFWADVMTPRERDRAARRKKIRAVPEDAEQELSGNKLLASLCKTGRDFAWLLLDQLDGIDHELFQAPDERTMLGTIQSDIFHLREPARPRRVAEGDHSIRVHCCHGPMREIEVLHDQLLAIFAENPDLAPRDVLVTMPDVETYAPFIEAVFGAPESEAAHIPFTIADRAARTENGVASALLRLLDLVGGRFTAPSVLALLDAPVVRRRFGLTEADLPLVRSWTERAGIRWGIDAEHRAALGLPAFAQNSWRAGLDRLLLGYALPGDGGALFGGVLPEPAIEGSLAATLGRFVEFVERLFRHTPALAAPHPPAAWEQSLRALLDEFFDSSDDFADELRAVSRTLEHFAQLTAAAGLETPLEFAVIRSHLATALAESGPGHGFLAGRVTFCALKPMRSIPFRVICMLGLDDAAFPRHDRPPAFDLMAQKPKRGDRTPREDDRYLFLEALFSARETLYLSYAGLSPNDNTESPPSVLVGELLDYLGQHFVMPGDFVVKHRLQPFSPAYFTGKDARLFSYSTDNAAAARQGALARTRGASFCARPLPGPDAEWRNVTLDQLADFLSHPARYFLRNRLRLRLPEAEAGAADSEPQSLEGLDRHRLRDELTQRSIAARAVVTDPAIAKAAGTLPAGYCGISEYGEVAAEVACLLARIGPALDEPLLDPLPFELVTDGWHLSGTMTDVRASALVRFRAAKLGAADRLRTWVAHLALQLAAPTDHPRTTIFHGTDLTVRFQPVADAADQLSALLASYAQGISAPLRYFPETSWEFAVRTDGIKGGRTEPLQAARNVWLGSDYNRPESGDRWFQLAFRGVDDPLDAEFERLALAVVRPMLQSMEETE